MRERLLACGEGNATLPMESDYSDSVRKSSEGNVGIQTLFSSIQKPWNDVPCMVGMTATQSDSHL
jgi:hypothetical protein